MTILRSSVRPELADGKIDNEEARARADIPGNDLRIAHIPYDNPDGTGHFVAGAFYGFLRETLPRYLPDLLPQSICSYEIRDSPGKGRGLFATRDIQFGQLIVDERPSIITPTTFVFPAGSDVTAEEFYKIILDYLTKDDTKIVLSLANSKGPKLPFLAGIMATNAIEIDLKGGTDSGVYGGLFPTISRANHSCGPNSAWRFNYDTFTLNLYPTRSISAGEEITASYLDLSWNRAKRLYELNRKYHFTCTCPYCSGTSSADSDFRRRELQNWSSTNLTFEKLVADPKQDRKTLIKSSLRALVMIEKEGLQGTFAHRHYWDLAMCYGALADAKNMKKWGWKLILVLGNSGGTCEVLVDMWVDFLLNSQKFPFWGRVLKE
ncbi:SET domain-containing protein [Ramaria rubella]|nr:SET domain-containing protein [Ramaria rubella]